MILRIVLIALGLWVLLCAFLVLFVAGGTRKPTPGSPRWLRSLFDGDD